MPASASLARYRPWFYAAALYNLAWGAINILFPRLLFDLVGMRLACDAARRITANPSPAQQRIIVDEGRFKAPREKKPLDRGSAVRWKHRPSGPQISVGRKISVYRRCPTTGFSRCRKPSFERA